MNKTELEAILSALPPDTREVIIKGRNAVEVFFTSDIPGMEAKPNISRAPATPYITSTGFRYRIRAAGGVS